MECKQWVYRKKEDSDEVYNPRVSVLPDPGEEKQIPRAYWAEEETADGGGVFIPGHCDGWSGPIITYFERLDNIPEWFSA